MDSSDGSLNSRERTASSIAAPDEPWGSKNSGVFIGFEGKPGLLWL